MKYTTGQFISATSARRTQMLREERNAKAGLTAEQWIVLRLLRALIAADAGQHRHPEYVKSMDWLIRTVGCNTLMAAIRQLEGEPT
jgi:hypothetical protein